MRGRKTREQLRPSEQHTDPGILQDQFESFYRIVRVQREIRPSRLPHREERYDQVDGAFEAEPDDDVRSHSAGTKIMRQLIGPCIQLSIGRMVGFMHHRDCIRRLSYLVLEPLLDTPVSPSDAQHDH